MIEGKLLKVNTKIVALSLVAMAVVGGFGVELAYAESSSANASVTVANTILLTLTGGDLVIDNLTPGNASDSNVITASVTSNSPYGFHLSATTGTSGGTTSLVNTADSNFTFTNLNSNKITLADFSDNTWGYSYSADGTNWISGDYGAGATAGYNGLPLDGNDDGDSGVVLFNSDSYLGSKSVQFKIGAKSATTQAAGTYTNTVNFYAVTNPEPPKTIATATTMQEVAPGVDGCPSTLTTGQVYTLIDSRDDTEYHVAKLADGNCWMLDNLSLNLIDTNLSDLVGKTNASETTLGYLKNGGGNTPYPAGSVNNSWMDSYVLPRIVMAYKDTVYNHTDNSKGNNKTGGYYNYCAASAGSYCYASDAGIDNPDSLFDISEDICPSGWHIPSISYNDNTNPGEYNYLLKAIGNDFQNLNGESATLFKSELGLSASGMYANGSQSEQNTSGFYWSASIYDSQKMWNLFTVPTNVLTTIASNRSNGLAIRCVLTH